MSCFRRMKMWQVFAVIMALMLTNLIACAEGGTVNGFTYEVKDDNTAVITACELSGDITIPATIDGYTVTSLASRLFYGRSTVTSVSIPATVSYFGDDPDDNMWDYVFSYCYGLKEITVASGNPTFRSVDGVLYSKDMTLLINYPPSREGSSYHVPAQTEILCCTSFASQGYLSSLYLDGIDTYWMTYTFYNTGNLTVFYLPGGYSETRAKMFMDKGLSYESDTIYCKFREYQQTIEPDLVLPGNLTKIGAQAFAGVTNVVIRVPESVNEIGDAAFDSGVTILCPAGSYAESYCITHDCDVITE